MRLLFFLSLFLLVSCGKNRPWPAAIQSFQGFSETEQAEVVTLVNQLNTEAGKTLIKPTKDDSLFPIFLVKSTPEQIQSAKTSLDAKAGLATIDETQCTVQIATTLFKDAKGKEYLKTVVWHELGHCGGLLHDPKQGEVMFAVSSGREDYKPEAWDRFLSQFKKAVGL